MNAHEKTFGSPSGEPSTTRSMLQQMCEKVWTLPAQIEYLEWTASNHLRHSKFVRLRDDRDAPTVVKENAGEG